MKITINPDTQIVEKIRAALKKNDGYCPCSPLKIPETKCMCKNFLEDIEEGYCHCNLYYKEKE